MINNIETKKKLASSWFSFLQNETCILFERLEKLKSKKNFKKFSKRKWKKSNKSEGGGTSYLMTDGQVFDKVGINFSEVSGFFKKEFRNKILGASKDGSYWASGISIVAHMKNPKIPALHFNTGLLLPQTLGLEGGWTPHQAKRMQ